MRSQMIASYEHFKQLFLNCLRSQGWDDNILLHFARNSVYHLPYQHFRGRPRASQTSASWWLVLPFHPV